MIFHGVEVYTNNDYLFMRPLIYTNNTWKDVTAWVYTDGLWKIVGGAGTMMIPFIDSNGKYVYVNNQMLQVKQ